jgi:glycogen operon protein
MLVAGDEFGRTQQGNNNAYCQDNEISWLDWKNADAELLEYTKALIHTRKSHSVFCRRRWFQGQPISGTKVEDIAWFLPNAKMMDEKHWNNEFAKSLGVYLNGLGIHWVDPQGQRITDDSFYVIFNAHHESLEYTLPGVNYGKHWWKVLDTSDGSFTIDDHTFDAGSKIKVEGRSVVLLCHPISKSVAV